MFKTLKRSSLALLHPALFNIRYSGSANKNSFNVFLRHIPAAVSSKLGNDLTVVSEYRDIQHTCVGLFIDAGSRYENKFENGIAHFFEHMAFKGTNNKEKQELHNLMGSTGARFKSFTSRELVGYYAQCIAADTPQVIDILIDCIYNNKLDPQEIEKQKQAVYCEMLEHDKDNYENLFDYLHGAAFHGTGLANTIVGPSVNLYNFNTNTISNYLETMFIPSRTVLAFVGPLNHECVVKLAETHLKKIDSSRKADKSYRYSGGDFRFRDDSLPFANVAIAFEAPSEFEDEAVVLDVAAAFIGGWDSKQMGTRENAYALAQASYGAHLADSYQTFYKKYKDCGLWGIHFTGDKLHMDEFLYNYQNLLMKLCSSITNNEVRRAKMEVYTKFLTHLEGATKTCIDLARWTLYNGFRPALYQRLKMIEQVTPTQIQNVCSKYLFDRDPVVAAVGPTESLPDYIRIRAGQYWLRM